ncbi:MAG: hypothetical protein KC469_03205 [Flavobacteriaceae bacterium]|nr:hypothetical protein [Flavobacteriaceae bacterium]
MLLSCSGRKQVEKALYTGNYDAAITNALKKLRTNKNIKRKQDFAYLLQDAYNKATARDLNSIDHLKKDGNPEQYKTIYELYAHIDARQKSIKPVLPLRIDGKELAFNFVDVSDNIVDYRYKTSEYLIDKGVGLLDTDDKFKSRKAYNLLNYIEKINPNFEENRSLMDEAYIKGLDHVIVQIENQTEQIIPNKLKDELLDFNAYGLNQFWTQYHTDKVTDINYDYELQLQLKQINISPEHVREKQINRKREIIDGWDYVYDSNGNVKKDSSGNDIKVDKIIEVKARYIKFSQFKSTQVVANVVYSDLQSNQKIDQFTIDSEFIFENFYAEFRGDKRALLKEDMGLLQNGFMDFPLDEQMVYDTGEDLKLKFKQIIKSYKFPG